ncbi:hypothetical protein Q5O24_07220 [Eubacteriaceae bacterium ES3]|nr:hypothetical protein Q5O24_07220 [Eubacteriaceae bacterium ES3]
MKKTKNSESQKRRSRYNPQRNSYMTRDGRYAYVTWDDQKKHTVTHYLEIGIEGVTEELLVMLDEDDHQIDLQERYDAENTDFSFLNQQRLHNQSSEDCKIDPIDAIRDKKSDPFDLIFPQDDKTSELMPQLLEAMNKLTDAQRDLIYNHLGSMKQLEEILKDEIAVTGKVISQQAMSNRWKKIITRLCKEFDVQVPRKRKGKNDK